MNCPRCGQPLTESAVADRYCPYCRRSFRSIADAARVGYARLEGKLSDLVIDWREMDAARAAENTRVAAAGMGLSSDQAEALALVADAVIELRGRVDRLRTVGLDLKFLFSLEGEFESNG